jgi:hypothetical protein
MPTGPIGSAAMRTATIAPRSNRSRRSTRLDDITAAA